MEIGFRAVSTRGVRYAIIDQDNGHLLLTMTDGKVLDLGSVTGRGIADVEVLLSGELKFTFYDGTSKTVGEDVYSAMHALEQSAAGSAGDAEAWAVGKRGDVDVPDTDPAYDNHSKYWAGQSATSAASVLALQAAVEDLLKDYYYVPIEITAFAVDGTNPVEVGSSGTKIDVDLAFTINKEPAGVDNPYGLDTLVLDGDEITPAASGTVTVEDVVIDTPTDNSHHVTWTLTAADVAPGTEQHPDPSTDEKTAELYVYNRVYYGASASGTLNNLEYKVLSGTKARTFTVDAGIEQYIWYAVPKRMGACTFKVGGFDGGFEAPQTVSVTNVSGYTEDYYVYRSTNAALGSTTVVAS